MPINEIGATVSARSAWFASWLASSSVADPENTPDVAELSVKLRLPVPPAATPAPRLPVLLKPVPVTVAALPISTSVNAPEPVFLMLSALVVVPTWTIPKFRVVVVGSATAAA